MASLILRTPDGHSRTVDLLKRITTLGSGPDNDVKIDDPAIPADAIHIVFDGKNYQVGSHGVRVQINGTDRDKHTLQANDLIRLGSCEISFRAEQAETARAEAEMPDQPSRELLALRRLTGFSERLLAHYELDRLLEDLMDEAIDLSRADKGFLILVENDEQHVRVARNISRENIANAIERVSDSIVTKVVQSRKPLIISDALDDPEFNASQSVINLKLLSVMCVPLMHRGTLLGLIYVGNDRLVNRFAKDNLDLLMVFASQASLILQNAKLVNELRVDNSALRRKLEAQQYGDIVGACQTMKEVYRRIDKIAPTDISVLITGETGTGKEQIAREIHRRSPRSKGPFVVINCGAIPENLLESELFGHAKGAFTGAVATKVGRFQAANGGTLFLDEIGDMPTALQVKLLRALQERIVYKVGDHRGEPVDIRVVTATNKVLEDEVKRGAFREDLYYRLNVVTIQLPPLRERGEDIEVLAKYFLQKQAQEFDAKVRSFSDGAIVAIKKYGWPGNIRELENRIKKAVVLTDKLAIGAEDLDLQPENLDPIMPLAQAKEEFQKRYINDVLRRNNENRTKTAKDLGVDPRTIFRHLEKLEADRSVASSTAEKQEQDETGL